MEQETEWKPDENLRRIVCAANRYVAKHMDYTCMFLGPRHWDDTMRAQYKQAECEIPHFMFEQGFIDNFGKWHTREEALVIARRMDQVVRELDYDTKKLFSEMLY
jgi:hypothetical protein